MCSAMRSARPTLIALHYNENEHVQNPCRPQKGVCVPQSYWDAAGRVIAHQFQCGNALWKPCTLLPGWCLSPNYIL